jgi:glyoxylase-like metal-dependent hydrolase (beta-lactamase superfamily II)
MPLRIEILTLGEYEIDWSKIVQYKTPGRKTHIKVHAYLILGGSDGPMLVDTGFRRLPGAEEAEIPADRQSSLEKELGRHGLRPADIRYVLHTHLHKGHCGRDDVFPSSTTVVMNRRELEFGCSGVDCESYSAVDMKHLIDRVHTPGAAWLLDLESSGTVGIVDGVCAQLCGGHTEGSMNVLVELDGGIAVICGDIIFHVHDQLVAAGQLNHREPRLSGSVSVSQVDERAAIKKAIAGATWLLPMHDAPAKIAKGGLVVGRVVGTTIPGSVTELEAFRTT